MSKTKAKPKAEVKYTEADLVKAILKTWPMQVIRPRYVTALQVRNEAGFAAGRMLDAVVIDTWPSEGLIVHGMEIKTTISDLRRELSDPGKALAFEHALDRFSIVAPPSLATPSTLAILPPQWGLYAPTEQGTLRACRKPVQLRHEKTLKKMIPVSFAAAFARALVDRGLSEAGLADVRRQSRAEADQSHKFTINELTADRDQLKTTIKNFEEASGLRLYAYDAGRIGEAVAFVLHGGLETRISYVSDIRQMAQKLIQFADELEAISKAMAIPEHERHLLSDFVKDAKAPKDG